MRWMGVGPAPILNMDIIGIAGKPPRCALVCSTVGSDLEPVIAVLVDLVENLDVMRTDDPKASSGMRTSCLRAVKRVVECLRAVERVVEDNPGDRLGSGIGVLRVDVEYPGCAYDRRDGHNVLVGRLLQVVHGLAFGAEHHADQADQDGEHDPEDNVRECVVTLDA